MESERVIPVVSEEVEAGTRTVETGAVRVHKTVHERTELIEQPLFEEDVEVERVMKNERVDGPLPMREEGDTMIIPVVKQVLRVDWVLTEEVHLKRHRCIEHSHHPVTVLEEHAEVERVGEAEKRENQVDTRGAIGGRRPSFLGKLKPSP